MLLIDSIGAMLSAFFLGYLLPAHDTFFSMPLFALQVLAVVAFGLACYSGGCYLFANNNHHFYLLVVCVANILYCLITLTLTITYYYLLTLYDILYFALEIPTILILAYFEYLYASGKRP